LRMLPPAFARCSSAWTTGSSPVVTSKRQWLGIARMLRRIARTAFYFVIAGLDPAIHAASPARLTAPHTNAAHQHGPPGHRRAKRRRSFKRLCPVVTRGGAPRGAGGVRSAIIRSPSRPTAHASRAARASMTLARMAAQASLSSCKQPI
jgi:hypothetical protein